MNKGWICLLKQKTKAMTKTHNNSFNLSNKVKCIFQPMSSNAGRYRPWLRRTALKSERCHMSEMSFWMEHTHGTKAELMGNFNQLLAYSLPGRIHKGRSRPAYWKQVQQSINTLKELQSLNHLPKIWAEKKLGHW